MDEDLSEPPRQSFPGVAVEVWVSEEDDEMLEQGAPDLPDRVLVEVPPDIDPMDLSAERARDR